VAAALRRGDAAASPQPQRLRWATALAATAAAAAALLIAWQVIIRIQSPDGQETTIRPQPGAKVIVENGGQQIAAVTDGSQPPFRALAGHKGKVWSVAFAGNRLLSCGEDQWVRVWDIESGAEVQRFDGHRNFVFGLAVSPDGKRALSSSGSNILSKLEDVTWSVCLWEIESGKELQRLEGRGPGITSVALSPDGSQALFAGYDGTVRLWDVAAWREVSTFRIIGGAWSVCFSPDARRALTAGGTGAEAHVTLWQLPEGTELKRYVGHKFGSWHATFLPGGHSLISGGQDDALRLWDTDSARQTALLRHDGQVARIAVTADGKYAVAGAWVNQQQHSLRLFQLDPANELHVFRGPWAPLNAVALSPDGRWCAAGSSDGSLRLWRMPKLPGAAPASPPSPAGRGPG
jgi:WD40 repeat protein